MDTFFSVLLANPRMVEYFAALASRIFPPPSWISMAAPASSRKAKNWKMCSGNWMRWMARRKASTSSAVTSSSKAALINWKVLERSWIPSFSVCSTSARYWFTEKRFSLEREATGKNLVTVCSEARGSTGEPLNISR